MSKKLSLSGQSHKTVEVVFNNFVISQTAQSKNLSIAYQKEREKGGLLRPKNI